MRRLLLILVLLFAAAEARTQPVAPRFVAIAFHDVADTPSDLRFEGVTTQTLVQFFDWLKGNGWAPVSLDQVQAAAGGGPPLPDKAILITFDDGLKSLYTRVFPLLRAYRYPAVAALVGSWMEDTPDGTVKYGDQNAPRSTFVSWDEAREMQASGLVEFASHTYDLHRGALANPQGNLTPAAQTWLYDPKSQTYEDDGAYRARILADLERSRAAMQAHLGRPPRAIAWPYGRYTGPGLEVAKQSGFTFALTLDSEPAYASDPFAIQRFYPTGNPTLADLVRDLSFEPARPKTIRITCLSLDALAAAGEGPAQDQALGRMIEDVRTLGTTTVVIDAAPAPPSSQSPLGPVYFPTPLRPLRLDLLSRATWQIRSRAGVDVFVRLPIEAATAAVGRDKTPELFADMLRNARADGVAVEAPPVAGEPAIPLRRDAARARRAALDLGQLPPETQLGLEAYRAAAAIDPGLRLMLMMSRAGAPPGWADIAVQPQAADVAEALALASRLKAGGWLEPESAGRIAFSLPPGPEPAVEALRQAQRRGASNFALCPGPTSLSAPGALPEAFSASTYPYRP
jgi:peptidoglycan/xylan/chitin deacetylase (PgdA/CDA1 family)